MNHSYTNGPAPINGDGASHSTGYPLAVVEEALDHAPWAKAFLEEFAVSGSMRKACEVGRVSRTTVNERIERNPAFRESFGRAWSDAIDYLEECARERALTKSDRLLTFMLAAFRPEVYSPKGRSKSEDTQTVADAALAMPADDDNE